MLAWLSCGECQDYIDTLKRGLDAFREDWMPLERVGCLKRGLDAFKGSWMLLKSVGCF